MKRRLPTGWLAIGVLLLGLRARAENGGHFAVRAVAARKLVASATDKPTV